MAKPLDLTDQSFGYLKAISKAPSRNKKTYWLCECQLCGNKKEIQTCHLTNGSIKSCGCLNREKNFFGNDLIEKKKCLLCNKAFTPNTSSRVYCFECSPPGLSSAESLKFKKRKLKHILLDYKGNKCEKCGYDKCIAALQFHHINPNEKEFTLSKVNLNDSNFSLENLIKEVDKCQLLCANCHAEIHFTED